MPTKNEVLLKFQKDLQALNATFETEILRLEDARLVKFRGLESSRRLVEEAEAKRSEALAERHLDRTRAAAAREKALADAVKKRRDAFAASERAWRKAEEEAERKRGDKRTEENRKHADKLEEVGRILPMYKQTIPREAEYDRHEKAMARIQEDFNTAWDRAREDYQTANDNALAGERRDSEAAGDAERVGFEAAETEYNQSIQLAAEKLHDGLLKLEATRDLERGFQQQLLEVRQRWETEKNALRTKFKKDYDSAG
jgi:hypothetical protein